MSCGDCTITLNKLHLMETWTILKNLFVTRLKILPVTLLFLFYCSSSYSSSALDFETENKIDPVFDSPRMSRRSLRLAAGYSKSDDGQSDSLHDSSYAGNMSFRDQSK